MFNVRMCAICFPSGRLCFLHTYAICLTSIHPSFKYWLRDRLIGVGVWVAQVFLCHWNVCSLTKDLVFVYLLHFLVIYGNHVNSDNIITTCLTLMTSNINDTRVQQINKL